jgi:anti-anti-sigma factor
MDIALEVDRPVPILRLAGRFDGDGATAFDAFVDRLDPSTEHWILDFTGVRYLSSMGLRALVTAEKRLRARHGGLVLAGVSSHVRHVLEMAHLDTVLRIADSVDAAVRRVSAGSVAPHRATRSVREGRACAVWPLGGSSILETWGARHGAPAERADAAQLSTLTLADLAFAVGTGGLGATREQASEATGPLIAARTFAGLRTSATHNPSDFIVAERPGDAFVHVESAIGVDGSPALALEIACDTPFSIAELVDDVIAQGRGGSGLAMSPVEGPVTAIFALVRLADRPAPAILMLVVADDVPADREEFAGLFEFLSQSSATRGRFLVGRTARLSGPDAWPSMTADPMETLAQVATLDTLEEVTDVDPSWQCRAALVWSFRPARVREGREKLLAVDVESGPAILDEWETIARHLYRDCRRVVLTPLTGGFMSNTFRVASYDGDGRRLLPTVLKIGGLALTEREEAANRKYVQTFILNNSTTLLGEAVAGNWAGLRYNFLGVNGPDSALTWLRDHYERRPAAEVSALFRALFTRVLKPWYGQPRWEPIALYKEHDPRRLFPTLCEAAGEFLGVSSDTESLPCPELGRDLLNPYYFLAHEFPKRSQRSRLWYTSICHGDLNMQNVLVDERDNIYVIDFSETRPRNVVSDFARLEPIVKFEQIPIASSDDLRRLLVFEQGLVSARTLDKVTNEYPGPNVAVDKAFAVISLMRWLADTATIFETDVVPYWLALLEWTLPVVVFRQCSDWQKRYAVYSAGLIAEAILGAEPGA